MRFYDNKLNKIESNYVPKNIPWEFLYKTFEKEQAGIDKVKVEAEEAKDLFNINPGEHFDKAGVEKVLAPYREQYDALTNDIRSGNYSAAENAAKLTGFVSKYKADKKVNALKQAEGEYVKYTQDRLDPKKNQEFSRAMNPVFYKGEIQNLIDPSTASESDINNAYRFRIAPTTGDAFKDAFSYLKPQTTSTIQKLINNKTVRVETINGKPMVINQATNKTDVKLTGDMVEAQLLERGKQLALDPNQDELYGFRVEEYARNGWGEYTPEMYAKEGRNIFTGEIDNRERSYDDNIINQGKDEPISLNDIMYDGDFNANYDYNNSVTPTSTDMNTEAGTKEMGLFDDYEQDTQGKNPFMVWGLNTVYLAKSMFNDKPNPADMNSPAYKNVSDFLQEYAATSNASSLKDAKLHLDNYNKDKLKGKINYNELHAANNILIKEYALKEIHTSKIPMYPNRDDIEQFDINNGTKLLQEYDTRSKTLKTNLEKRRADYEIVEAGNLGKAFRPISDNDYSNLIGQTDFILRSNEAGEYQTHSKEAIGAKLVTGADGKDYFIKNKTYRPTQIETMQQELYTKLTKPSKKIPINTLIYKSNVIKNGNNIGYQTDDRNADQYKGDVNKEIKNGIVYYQFTGENVTKKKSFTTPQVTSKQELMKIIGAY